MDLMWAGLGVGGAVVAWFVATAPRRRAAIAERAYQSRCDYAVLPTETGCYRASVNAKAGGGFDIGECSNCVRGAPRWVTKEEVAKFEQQVADGWITRDGKPCPVDLYQEAFRRQTTPAKVLAERGQRT